MQTTRQQTIPTLASELCEPQKRCFRLFQNHSKPIKTLVFSYLPSFSLHWYPLWHLHASLWSGAHSRTSGMCWAAECVARDLIRNLNWNPRLPQWTWHAASWVATFHIFSAVSWIFMNLINETSWHEFQLIVWLDVYNESVCDLVMCKENVVFIRFLHAINACPLINWDAHREQVTLFWFAAKQKWIDRHILRLLICSAALPPPHICFPKKCEQFHSWR